MTESPHVAALVQDAWNHHLGRALSSRGWRNFVTSEVPHARVSITLPSGVVHETTVDRTGNLDVVLDDPGSEPGWATVEIGVVGGRGATADILVVDPDQEFGLISDLDDTCIRTYLPRMMVAAWNSLVVRERARQPVPGMASLYDVILADRPGAPTFYVSTGAWSTGGSLGRFLDGWGFPKGPLLLTDWGPTNTGWFRSGREHKSRMLRRLAEEFPTIRWVLVGDDGQRDPQLYREFAREHPGRVRAIAIRQLEIEERVLAHGSTEPLDDAEAGDPDTSPVPEVRAPDGDGLLSLLLPLLEE